MLSKAQLRSRRLDPAEIEDVYLWAAHALSRPATGNNISARVRHLGWLPGDHRRRHHQPPLLSSGLNAIALAAQQIMTDGTDIAVGSGVESISLAQMGGINLSHFTEGRSARVKPAIWMSMIETAEIVAERYGISRERQDQYALQSQQRTVAAQAAGKNTKTKSCRSPSR